MPESAHPPPIVVTCTGGVAEALLWFHLARQLREGIKAEDYSITEVVLAGDYGKQRKCWLQDELPPLVRLERVTISKAMAKAFKKEVEEARGRGLLINIA